MRYAATLSLLLALGCQRHMLIARQTPPLDDGGVPVSATAFYLRAAPTTKLDLLLMIDNSNGMEAKQAALLTSFPQLVAQLLPPGAVDIHLGIITSDMGAGLYTPPSCDVVGGDQGRMQNAPIGPTCATAHLIDSGDHFLAWTQDAAGTITANFVGDVGDAFACYAAVGTSGCGYEHQLASVRAALDGCTTPMGCKQTENAGFLRPDALLAVLLVTDEDDCSAPPTSTLFDPTQTQLTSYVGPLTSYRCFEFGAICDGQRPGRTQGTRDGCIPGSQDSDPLHQLVCTKDITDFLKSLKPDDPRTVYAATVTGPPTPVAVGLDANGYPKLQPSCMGGLGAAYPTLRLTEFLSYFDQDRGVAQSICAPDLDAPLASIGNDLGRLLGRWCLPRPARTMIDASGRAAPDCVVWQGVRGSDPSGWIEVPPCAATVCDPATAPGGDCACQRHPLPGAGLCWYVWDDPVMCDSAVTPAQTRPAYRLGVDRGTDGACTQVAPPPRTELIVDCSYCGTGDPAANGDCSGSCAPYVPGCFSRDGGAQRD